MRALIAAAFAAVLVLLVGPAGAETLDLNALYQAAQPGDTIVVPAGDYAGQSIYRDADKPAGAAPVTIRFEDGAKLGGLSLGNNYTELKGPDGLILEGLDVGYLLLWQADRITLDGMDSEWWDVFASRDVLISGGDIGPCAADGSKACVPRIAGSQRVVVDRHYFHDITTTDAVRWHVDGLAIFGSQDVTVKRSRFDNNEVTHVRVQNCCGNPPLANIAFLSNWFGDVVGEPTTAGIEVDSPVPGLRIEYNSFHERASIQLTGAQTDAKIVGNLMMSTGCYSGVTYSDNVFTPFSEYTGQTPCGPTDRKVDSFGYVDGPGFDYRLTPASPVYAQRALYEQAAPQSAPEPDPEPTPDPEPDPVYAPACAPTCDEQIAELEGTVSTERAKVTARDKTITGLRDKLSQINALSAG